MRSSIVYNTTLPAKLKRIFFPFRLRDETKKLMQEKEDYQETAKATLKKLVDEKLEAVNKQKELEKALSNIEDEYASLKELHDKDVAQNRELAVQVIPSEICMHVCFPEVIGLFLLFSYFLKLFFQGSNV